MKNLARVLVLLSSVLTGSAFAACQTCPTNAAPWVTLTSPANGATTAAPGSFTLSANAGDDSAVDAVEFFVNNVSVGVDSTAPYSVQVSALAVGSYTIKAKATDDMGKSASSAQITVSVTAPTNAAPQVGLSSPSSGATAAAPGSFALSAWASDSDGSIASVQFRSGSTVLYTATAYPYAYTWSSVPAGSYSLTAVATDNLGATATSAPVTVTVSAPPPNSPPSVSLTSPANEASLTVGSAVTLTAAATDTDGSVSSVAFYSNNQLVGTAGSAPYSVVYAPSTAGAYAIKAVATDNAGASATSSSNTLTANTPAPVSLTRYYVYDDKERLCETIDPEAGTTLIDYDGAGNIAWTITGTTSSGLTAASCAADRAAAQASQKTTRQYDALNRVTAVLTPGGTADVSTSYTADGLPEVITAANPGGNNVVTRYTYNKRRLLVSERSENGSTVYTLEYGYTQNGHLSRVKYPDLQEVLYSPDALGRTTQVTSAGGEVYASGISYFPNGAIAQFTYGNGLVHRMTQNVRRLAARSQDLELDANGNIVRRVLDDTYSFDPNGNVLDITDQAQNGLTTRGMSYDGLDRLKTAVSPSQWGNASYSYDALDNLTAANLGARQFRYVYDTTTNRLSAIKSPTGNVGYSFSHDVRGNVTAKTVGSGCGSDASLQCASALSLAMVFDSSNRLNQVTGSQAYRYDGLGRRVQTTDAGTSAATYWIYSQAGQVLYSTEARRSRNIAYIYLGNTQVATRTVAWGSGTAAVRYQHTDALGSPVAETDGNKVVTKRNSFSPWGEPWGTTSVDGTGYTGHVMDQGTGLTYMQQRYYDPQIGRFLSTDPAESEFNRYNYASNNPYRFTDPDGRKSDACGVTGCNEGGCNPCSGGGGNDDAEIREQYRHDTGRGAHGAQQVADAASKGADAVDNAAVATVHEAPKYAVLYVLTEGVGAAFSRLLRFIRAERAAATGADVAGIQFRSDTSHIFREARGHLAQDTAQNRALLLGAVKPSNLVGKVGPNGSISVYKEVMSDGRQVWVEVRNGSEITNGGVNLVPRN